MNLSSFKWYIFYFVSVILLTTILFFSIPGDKHLQKGIVATNDWRQTTKRLPSLLSTTSALGKWELDNGTIKEVHFSGDPKNPIEEYTVKGQEKRYVNLFANKEQEGRTLDQNYNKYDMEEMQGKEVRLATVKHLKKLLEQKEYEQYSEGKVKDKESDFSFIWYPRKIENRPPETKYEGVVATQSLINPFTQPPSLFVKFIAQESLSFFTTAFTISFRAVAPPLASNQNERKWYAFGYGGDNTQQLKKLFNESNSSGSELVSEYLSSTINESTTIKLFAEVCRAQEQKRKKSKESTTRLQNFVNNSIDIAVPNITRSSGAIYSEIDNKLASLYENNSADAQYGGTNERLREKTNYDGVLPYMFKSACFWLSEFTFSENNSVVSGRAWSSCGDRLSYTSSETAYQRLLVKVNNVSVVLIFTLCLPVLFGIYTQINWIHNSRGRTLRVSLIQAYCNLYWVSFNLGLIAIFWIRTPSSRKALELLFSLIAISSAIIIELIMLVSKESARYSTENENVGNSMWVFLLLNVVFFAGMMSISFFEDMITHWIFIIAVSVFFWLPQIIHNYKMDSWAGLTTPFIVSNLLLILTSLVFLSSFTFKPWEVNTKTQRVALYGVLIAVIETCFLLIFSLTNGRHLLPHWMVPWRHVYATTVEEQRNVLNENVMCPICRASLEEGWDGDNELWQTPCHHLFHKSCLERWMLERMECPLCRTLLPEPE